MRYPRKQTLQTLIAATVVALAFATPGSAHTVPQLQDTYVTTIGSDEIRSFPQSETVAASSLPIGIVNDLTMPVQRSPSKAVAFKQTNF